MHLCKVNFVQLIQCYGILFCRSKLNEIINLFKWTHDDVKELNELTGAGGRDIITNKIYHHVVYTCKYVCTFAIKIDSNVR